MSATNAFFIWFFTGLKGLGGWLIFLFLAFAAVIWIFYDSSKRNLPVLGWRLGASLLALLLLPVIIYRFSSVETRLSLDPFIEAIFYLGLLGGILPAVLAIGYYVTYKGLLGCKNGHVYEAVLGQCPECAAVNQPFIPQPPVGGIGPRYQPGPGPEFQEPRHVKPKATAWLVDQSGRSYQLARAKQRSDAILRMMFNLVESAAFPVCTQRSRKKTAAFILLTWQALPAPKSTVSSFIR